MTALFFVAAAVALTLFMFRRASRSTPIAYFAAYATYFLMGPILSSIIGGSLAPEGGQEAPSTVASWYLLAIVGLAIADALPGLRNSRPKTSTVRSFVPAILIGLGLYGLLNAILIGFNAPTKRAGLEAVNDFHYRFLVIEAIVVASYWFFRDASQCRISYTFNAIAYVVYCLSFRERDFVFVAFAIVTTGIVFGQLRARWGLFAAILGAYLATGLFARRSGRELSLGSVLNEGSNLFVDSYLAASSSFTIEPITHTYFRLVTLQAPTDVGGTGAWFKGLYAPGGSSGYGFSLVGEARYNIGILGILAIFALLGLCLRAAYSSNFRWNPRITGPSFLFILLYALRGDLRAVVVGVAYIVILHLIVAAGASVGTAVPRGPKPPSQGLGSSPRGRKRRRRSWVDESRQ